MTPSSRPVYENAKKNVTPEEIRPFSKAGPRKVAGGRKKIFEHSDTLVNAALISINI